MEPQKGAAPGNTVQKRSLLRRISDAVDKGLSGFFRVEGRLVATYPWWTIIICLVVTLLCMLGFARFQLEQDADKLYTPNNAASVDDKNFVDTYYKGADEAGFSIYALDKTVAKGNVLDKKYLLEHLRCLEAIFASTVTHKGRTVTWGEYCFKVGNTTECKIDSVLRFWNYDRQRLQADPNILSTINNASFANYDGQRISLPWVLGGIQRDQAGGAVRAEVLQTIVYIKSDPVREKGATVDHMYDKWNKVILKVAYDDWESPLIKQYVSSNGAIGRESADAINRDVMLLTIGYILLIAYLFIALWRNSKPYQKTHMTLAGLLAIGCGIATDFGILSATGLKFNFVCQVLPFLLVGIGSDNIFVLISGLFQQDPDAPVPDRISSMMAESGAAITVTSVTNIIAFAVGTYTNLDALYVFSIYASVGFVFIYIYSITMFVAILALDARREQRARQRGGDVFACSPCCMTCCDDPYRPGYENGMPGWVPAGSVLPSPPNPHFNHKDSAMDLDTPKAAKMQRSASSSNAVADVASETAARSPAGSRPPSADSARTNGPAGLPAAAASRDYTTPGYCGTGRFDPKADTLATKIVARWLPRATLHPAGKVIVLILQSAYLAAAIYGCTQVYMDFQFREMFVPKDNWLHKAFAVQKDYFIGDASPVGVYTKAAPEGKDYFDYQDELAAIGPAMRANPYIAATPRFDSWYGDFSAWLAGPTSPYRSSLTPAGRAPNATAFNAWVKEWVEGPGRIHVKDVVFEGGRIITSRFDGLSKDVKDGSWAVKMLDSTRKTAVETAPGLQAFAYGEGFVFYDGFKSITWSTIVNVITAGAAVFAVTLLLLGNLGGSITVGVMVVMCDIGVLGMMHYAGLTFNVVTCIVIVMAVGIAVDYSAHIMRAYLISSGTYQERAHKALEHIGGAVWNGILTTFIAVIPMAAAKHYIFTSIFKMFVFLIWVSAWHGLVLLPVLLSFWGPASYSKALHPSHLGASAV